MRGIYHTIEKGGIGLFESPTGNKGEGIDRDGVDREATVAERPSDRAFVL